MHFFFCETDICIQMQKTWWKSLLHERQNILNPAPVQWIVYIQLQERDEAIAGSINKSVCQASKDMCGYCVAPLGCRHSRDGYINRRKAIKWNSRLTSMLKLKKKNTNALVEHRQSLSCIKFMRKTKRHPSSGPLTWQTKLLEQERQLRGNMTWRDPAESRYTPQTSYSGQNTDWIYLLQWSDNKIDCLIVPLSTSGGDSLTAHRT